MSSPPSEQKDRVDRHQARPLPSAGASGRHGRPAAARGADRVPPADATDIPPAAARRKESLAAGTVALVGAGPGDPELLTLKAVRLLRQADVCVYDHLVSDELLRFVPEAAELIYVGKETSNHTLPQDRINALLVALARAGKRVVRLKGGDPFVFGRGGEEMQFLARHGVAFEVVAGVTSASGASASAAIPLTHRDYAQACTFVTGHPKCGADEPDWEALARRNQTLVIYMGIANLAAICSALRRHGLPDDWPAAVIERATTSRQRVIGGTLASLPERVAGAAVQPPALIIIGEVVKLRAEPAVFGNATVNAVAPWAAVHA